MMWQLQHALAIEMDVPSFRNHLITDTSTIISVCAGLLDYTKYGWITFSHETVRPFLENKLGKMPSHSEMCRICLTYLRIPPPDTFIIEERRLALPFTEYASDNWAKHAVRSERRIELATAILQTFGTSSNPAWLGKTFWQLIIEAHVTFIFIPDSASEPCQSRYVFIST
jgi:hypothetical protein